MVPPVLRYPDCYRGCGVLGVGVDVMGEITIKGYVVLAVFALVLTQLVYG